MEKISFDVETYVFLKKIKLVTHTAKLNAGNPTDSLETQSIKVLHKNSVFKFYYNELTVIK